MSHNKHFIYCYLKLIVDNINCYQKALSCKFCSRRGHLSYNVNPFLGPDFKFDKSKICNSKIVGNFLRSKINFEKEKQ